MPTKPVITLFPREITPVKSKITLAVLDVLAAAQILAPRQTSTVDDQSANARHEDADAPARV